MLSLLPKGKLNATETMNGYDINEAVHRWSDQNGFQFRLKGSSVCAGYQRRDYYCIRSECRQKEGSKHLTFYDKKNINCPARLVVYKFDDEKEEKTVRIHQKVDHNHAPGDKFLTLLPEVSEALVRMFLINPSCKPTEYMNQQAENCGYNDNDKAVRMSAYSDTNRPRSEILTLRNVQRARDKARSKQYLLRKGESESVEQWIKDLGKQKVLCYQIRVEDAGASRKTFTPFQLVLLPSLGRDMLENYQGKPGRMTKAPISIDATYNTTKDPRMLLYTVIARDSEGHGVPLSHLLCDSKEHQYIVLWLRGLRQRFDKWDPPCVLTDTAPEQIKPISMVFSRDKVRLCSWHVLETFRKVLGGLR